MTRIGVACAAGLLVGIVGAAEAFNPQPEPPAFGMQGAVLGQIAQLNVVLTHPPDPQCDGLRATLEIVEIQSGKTVLLYEGHPPDPIVPPDPQMRPADRP